MIRSVIPLLLFLCLFFVACNKGPSPLSVTEYQLPTPGDLSAIVATSSGELVAVGGSTWDEGNISVWDPGTGVWTVDTSTERLLLDIFYQPASDRMYTLGLGGDFLFREGSANWEFRRLPDWAQFRGGYFFPDGSGWIVSGNAW